MWRTSIFASYRRIMQFVRSEEFKTAFASFWRQILEDFLHILPFVPKTQSTFIALTSAGMSLLSGVAPGIWNSFSATSMLHQFHLFLYLLSSPLTISFNFSPSAFYIYFITPYNICDAVCMKNTIHPAEHWSLPLTPLNRFALREDWFLLQCTQEELIDSSQGRDSEFFFDILALTLKMKSWLHKLLGTTCIKQESRACSQTCKIFMHALLAIVEAQRKPFLFIQYKTVSRMWLTTSLDLLCVSCAVNGNSWTSVLQFSGFYLCYQILTLHEKTPPQRLKKKKKIHIFPFSWRMNVNKVYNGFQVGHSPLPIRHVISGH